jgi:NTE family protein
MTDELQGISSIVKEFEQVALLLQGGGALASYQAGAYEALVKANIQPNWIIGISSGALNAAIIAGNPPEVRLERLRSFWRSISQPSMYSHVFSALSTFFNGRKGFFYTKMLPSFLQGHFGSEFESWYDPSPLLDTLVKFADFDRINNAYDMRVSIGVVNVADGECTYFDNVDTRLRPEHFLASCALPPGFPPVEIDGNFYWDAGLFSNTPLECLMYDRPSTSTLAIQLDLWSLRGAVPRDSLKLTSVMQDMRYSARTKVIQHSIQYEDKMRKAISALMALVPTSSRKTGAYLAALNILRNEGISVVDVAYKNIPYDDCYKAFDFSISQIEVHWRNGVKAMKEALG